MISSTDSGFSKKVDGLNQNQWSNYSRISGRFKPESVVDLGQNTHISCISQGNDLTIHWLIQDDLIRGIYRIPFIGPLLLSVFKRYTFAMTNEISAFAMVTHNAVLSVTEAIMDEHGLDLTTLNSKIW